MPRPKTLTSALCDEIVYHVTNLAHGVLDLTCVVAVGALIVASGVEPAQPAGPQVQARIIKFCPVLAVECISAEVLAPLGA